MTLLLGCIADDYTGASDLANVLTRVGLVTVQAIGTAGVADCPPGTEAVVVALKTRSIEPDEAVRLSLDALAALRDRGARQIYFKYCSTFDSTPRGNIGPVHDALRAATGGGLAVVCPAFPATGRTIYRGHLFVGDQRLDESPLKDHPLNPMRDSSLLRLLAAQSRTLVGLVPLPVVDEGPAAVRAALEALAADGIGAAVMDAVLPRHVDAIGAACAGSALVTGGSALAAGLVPALKPGATGGDTPPLPTVAGPEVLLAGSCSPATRRQVEAAATRWPTLHLDVEALLSGTDPVPALAATAAAHFGRTPVLIASSDDPEAVRGVQARFGADAGHRVEAAFGRLARALADRGARRFVVAGGETSGAVVDALGVRALAIGREIAPGVPAMVALGAPPFALTLKSGNFGGDDFFADALEAMP